MTYACENTSEISNKKLKLNRNEINALKIVSKFVDSSIVPVTDEMAAHLIIEVDGNHLETLMSEMESISELLMNYDCGEVFFADDAQQKEALWKLRRRVAEALKLTDIPSKKIL